MQHGEGPLWLDSANLRPLVACFQSFLTKFNVGWSPWTAVDALVGLRLTGLARPDLGVRRGRGRPPHIHRYKNFRNRTLETLACDPAPPRVRARRPDRAVGAMQHNRTPAEARRSSPTGSPIQSHGRAKAAAEHNSRASVCAPACKLQNGTSSPTAARSGRGPTPPDRKAPASGPRPAA